MKYTRKQITEAIRYWKRRLRRLNESDKPDAVLGGYGFSKGDDLIHEIYRKGIYRHGPNPDDNMEKLLKKNFLENFWKPMYTKAPKAGFYLSVYEVRCEKNRENVANIGYGVDSFKPFDKSYRLCAIVDAGEGDIDEDFDKWQKYIKNYFSTTVKEKFGIEVDFVFDVRSDHSEYFTAVADKVTVLEPKLIQKIVDPEAAKREDAEKSGEVKRIDVPEKDMDLVEICKKKLTSGDLRQNLTTFAEKMNELTMKGEYNEQCQIKFRNDPDVSYAKQLVATPVNAHDEEGCKAACKHASQVIKDNGGLDTMFLFKDGGSDKPAKRAIVVDVNKFCKAAGIAVKNSSDDDDYEY